MLISLYLIVIFDTEVLKVSGILMPLEQFDTSLKKINLPRQGLSHQLSVIIVLVKVRHCSHIQESYYNFITITILE